MSGSSWDGLAGIEASPADELRFNRLSLCREYSTGYEMFMAPTHAFVFNCGIRVFNYVGSNFSKARAAASRLGIAC